VVSELMCQSASHKKDVIYFGFNIYDPTLKSPITLLSRNLFSLILIKLIREISQDLDRIDSFIFALLFEANTDTPHHIHWE
jgi:hypothetical protein